MTSRELRIGQLILSVAFAGLGIWALAKADYFFGVSYLAFGAAWLLIAAFRDGWAASWKEKRVHIRS